MDSLLLGWPIQERAQSDSDRGFFRNKKKNWKNDDLAYSINYGGGGHLITFAPTGAGKGVSCIIPNLLSYTGPIITIDPKGENFAVTARYRQDVLKQEIVLFDPFEYVSDDILRSLNINRSSINPLDLGGESPTEIENQAMMLASLIAGDSSQSLKDPFWDYEGRKLLFGIIAHIITSSRTNLSHPQFKKVVETLFPKSGDLIYELAVLLEKDKPSAFVQRVLGNVISAPENQRGGIIGTAQSYFVALLSEQIQYYLSESNISLPELAKRDDYTVYIVIPPSKLASHSMLLRLVVGAILNVILERPAGQRPKKNTLFILDECAQLGELDALRKAVTLMRGYGVQVWMFFQDLSQIEYLYSSDYRTLINNCAVLQTFGLPRQSASLPVAEIIGPNKAPTQETSDLVMEVAQIISALDSSQEILSMSGGPWEIARRLVYHQVAALSARADPNPMYKPNPGADHLRRRDLLAERLTTTQALKAIVQAHPSRAAEV